MSRPDGKQTPKPLKWVRSSRSDLREFPAAVRREAGFALYLAQIGMKAVKAKPLKGFGGAGVLEVVTDHAGDTFRAVYTVRFERAVFVLHAFQKKSTTGAATPKTHIELIKKAIEDRR